MAVAEAMPDNWIPFPPFAMVDCAPRYPECKVCGKPLHGAEAARAMERGDTCDKCHAGMLAAVWLFVASLL